MINIDRLTDSNSLDIKDLIELGSMIQFRRNGFLEKTGLYSKFWAVRSDLSLSSINSGKLQFGGKHSNSYDQIGKSGQQEILDRWHIIEQQVKNVLIKFLLKDEKEKYQEKANFYSHQTSRFVYELFLKRLNSLN